MCEFCTKHGEGKKWYLNAKNYSSDLLSDLHRKKFVTNFFYWIDKSYRRIFPVLEKLPLNMPVVGPMSKAMIRYYFKNEHWAQVIPIEDVEKIFAMTNSIVRIPCICRKVTKGKEIRSCFITTLDPSKISVEKLLDQSYFGKPDVSRFEQLNKSEALNFMKDQETHGMFHLVWTHVTPFIAGICNCDNTGCVTFKMYKELCPIFFKAEYIAIIDSDRCVGCKDCISVCSFGALKHDNNTKKVVIDANKCYGCGICRSRCTRAAIMLDSRINSRTLTNTPRLNQIKTER